MCLYYSPKFPKFMVFAIKRSFDPIQLALEQHELNSMDLLTRGFFSIVNSTTRSKIGWIQECGQTLYSIWAHHAVVGGEPTMRYTQIFDCREDWRPQLQHCLRVTATAKSLESCPTLRDPIDSSPPGSPVPGTLQARTLEWVAISFSNAWKWKVKVKSLSRVRLLATPWTAAYQAPLSMGFSRQEYWSGVVNCTFKNPLYEFSGWIRSLVLIWSCFLVWICI